ncbi:MAG: hypothetical protein UY07_C0039G0006 [Parcubacteria group bacterium GW2011_GWA1_47_8]|nr:MAG: hypothetical protein UY07_C0039G0006 [Parcubacteria group bacterium GW2011_GWA1_47_8]KKW07667.1 MAG: hypothetical protein UY42_C0009G0040 [Parcubacteria group bacterium GW2011_GWA2_49_16]
METLVKADIFFFITSVAIVIASVVFMIAGFYLIQMLKNFRDISDKLKKAVDIAEEDIGSMHDQITKSWLYNFIFAKKEKSPKRKGSQE